MASKKSYKEFDNKKIPAARNSHPPLSNGLSQPTLERTVFPHPSPPKNIPLFSHDHDDPQALETCTTVI